MISQPAHEDVANAIQILDGIADEGDLDSVSRVSELLREALQKMRRIA